MSPPLFRNSKGDTWKYARVPRAVGAVQLESPQEGALGRDVGTLRGEAGAATVCLEWNAGRPTRQESDFYKSKQVWKQQTE